MPEDTDETETRIPEDEEDVLRIIAGDRDVDEIPEQEKNVAIAQAKLIGDI